MKDNTMDNTQHTHNTDPAKCTGDYYTCSCPECQYQAALDNYGERLAEVGSSAYMLYGNAADAMRVAYSEVRKPTRAMFGLPPEPERKVAPPSPVDTSDDIPF